MIEFLLQPNVFTGALAVALGVLVMIAFRKYAVTMKGTAVAHLGAALFLFTFQLVARLIWWDVFHGFGLGISSNWIWNILGLIACYHALRGFQLLLPEEDRKNFNIFTAVFYPRRWWWKLKAGNDVG